MGQTTSRFRLIVVEHFQTDFGIYFQLSDSDGETGTSAPKPQKRRSFLQQPKSYVSRLPAPGAYYSKPVNTKAADVPQPKIQDSSPPKTEPIPIPQQSPVSQSTFSEQKSQEFFIGDRVTIGGVKTGTLLYFGSIHIAPGQWCGIALDEPEGIHDGLVNDVRYFTCRKGHGIFAPVERVALLDTKLVLAAVKAKPIVSTIPSKIKVCHTSPIHEDVRFSERSSELLDDQDEDDMLDLDDNGILRDDDVSEISVTKVKSKTRRKLPKIPPQIETQESSPNLFSDESEEMSEAHRTFTVEEKYEHLEHQHSAGGSSGGEDSWSLSKDYLSMCDGKAQYLNITFDGESESKTSTQEPSEEESPSPEFIFDQEMIEDGEFATEPIELNEINQMSRDSSLGLISSFTLDKNDLINSLFGEEEDELVTSQGTLEAGSEDKVSSPERTPERQGDYDTSVDLDDGDAEIVSSAPFVDEKIYLTGTFAGNLTQTLDNEFDSSQHDIGFKQNLSCTFSLDERMEPNLNSTFTVEEKAEVKGSLSATTIKGKELMVDSGISMRGSMSESVNVMKGSMGDSGMLVKGALIEPGVRRCMLDSGISVQPNAVMESAHIVQSGEIPDKTKIGESVHKVTFGLHGESIQDSVKLDVHMVHSELDDQQLIQDLSDGHQRKERPISFLSTASADTGENYF